ncbi:hypothetical protein ACJJTC_019046 [Scirpophaga incertulas]
MASESSSAVLDLNDADTADDTEPPSMTDDGTDVIPLIMEHGYDIAVKVDAPVKQLSTLETFVTYRVRCVCARWPSPAHVRRRYNHFKVLHKRLCESQEWRAVPPLPPLHSARQQLDRYSPAFVALRTVALHAFLERVAKHPILTHSDELRLFLTTPDEDIERVLKPEGGALNLWGLGSALGGERPSNGPRVKDPEFRSAAEYLCSLQGKLCSLCSLTTKLHQGSAGVADDMLSMKRVCDAWSSQAGGRLGLGVGAVGTGAGGAAAARLGGRLVAGGTVSGGGAPLRARATLPLLAAYAAAHVEKIKQRDALHATYISGNNAAGDLHNRLEQASEAIRSELSDWIPKTRSEIKSLLLEIADRQVSMLSQTHKSWEHALKLSTETNASELFKTVSKNAIHNLSLSKHATPTETERDFEDLDSNSSEDFECSFKSASKSDNSKENFEIVAEINAPIHNTNAVLGNTSTVNQNTNAVIDTSAIRQNTSVINSDTCAVIDNNKSASDTQSSDDLVAIILRDGVNDSGVTETKDGKKETDIVSDPLRGFSDVDLSS